MTAPAVGKKNNVDDKEDIRDVCERLGLQPRRTHNGYSILCPLHSDAHHSAKVFDDDGFVACFAGCGRFHLSKVSGGEFYTRPSEQNHEQVHGDYTDLWLELDPLNQDIKSVPYRWLNQLGWRVYQGDARTPPGVFIPYFNDDRTKVLFYQVRHVDAVRRFTFPSGTTPIPYGYECLGKMETYLTLSEGARDAAVLRLAGIPAIALPSASSTKIARELLEYASLHSLIPIYLGDSDGPGDNLLRSMASWSAIMDARCKPYKDIAEMFEAEGIENIKRRYSWLRHKSLNTI